MDRPCGQLGAPEFELSEMKQIGPLYEPEACGGAATASVHLAHAEPGRLHPPNSELLRPGARPRLFVLDLLMDADLAFVLGALIGRVEGQGRGGITVRVPTTLAEADR